MKSSSVFNTPIGEELVDLLRKSPHPLASVAADAITELQIKNTSLNAQLIESQKISFHTQDENLRYKDRMQKAEEDLEGAEQEIEILEQEIDKLLYELDEKQEVL